jgi:tRNA G18 (ribose-2'-O)-methylase SpoU
MERNIINLYNNNTDDEIKQIVYDKSYNYVNLALNIHSNLNMGNMMRSSHLCGARKLIIFGRRKYDKRSCVGVSHYMTFERIYGIHDSKKNILLNDEESIEKLNEDDYILDENIFYNFIIENKYLPIFVEQDETSIIANEKNINIIIVESIKLDLTPLFIYGNETIGVPKNILNLRSKFDKSYTLELKQMGALQSYNVSNCLSILSYKIMEVFSTLNYNK